MAQTQEQTQEPEPQPRLLTDGERTRGFVLAGKSVITLVSQRTGTRYTYRIKAKEVRQGERPTPPWFVQLLRGPSNTRDYTFLGTIFEDLLAHDPQGRGGYRHSQKSPLSPEVASAKGFAWAWTFLSKGQLPPGCEVWHEGYCARCGRLLSVPESIAMGLGPECASGGF
jgi:hypothetical protein